MGEIRIVGPGKTRGYPYPVCKKKPVDSLHLGLPFDMSTSSKIAIMYVPETAAVALMFLHLFHLNTKVDTKSCRVSV